MKSIVIPYKFWAANQNKQNTTSYDNVIAQATSMEEAVFIRRFLWHYERKKREGNGWVFIVPKAFAVRVGMTVYAFRKVVRKWEKLKIIQTRSKGLPLKKYYRLNEDGLAKYLSGIYAGSHLIENDNLGCRNREDKVIENDKIYNASKSLEDKTVAGTERARRRPAKSLVLSGMDKARKTPERRLSISLYKIVSPHLKGLPNQLPKPDKDTGKKNWKSWDREFHQLLQALTLDKVTEVMEWYGQNYGGDFVPEIESARSFRQKFHKLLAAMKRQRADAERQKERRKQELRQDGLDEDPQPTADDLNDNSPYFQYTDEELEEMRQEEDRELEESRLRHEQNHRKTRRTRK